MAVLTARTRDPEEARQQVGDVYFPHRLRVHHDSSTFEMSMVTRRVGAVAFGRLSYSGEVAITTDDLETDYQVNVPLHGQLHTVTAYADVCADPSTAAVYRPDSPAALRGWTEGGDLFGLKIRRSCLESQLALLIDQPVRDVLRLDPTLDIEHALGRQWWSAACLLLNLTHEDEGPLAQPMVTQPLVRSVVAGLLYATGHQYRDLLDKPWRPAPPSTIRRVVELLEVRPEEPWTIDDLAETVGISCRSLQEGFRRHVGMPPTEYLRTVRLRNVHDDLMDAGPDRHTVAHFARRWGFAHLGRFAALYLKRYGESPSTTLRRPR